MILGSGGLGSIGSDTARALLDLGESVVLLATGEHPVPVPSGRGRLRRSGPPRPGTDRPAGHGKADASVEWESRPLGCDLYSPTVAHANIQQRHRCSGSQRRSGTGRASLFIVPNGIRPAAP